ncbi:MAG: 50S ribosomal protein L11 methyltransferase [Balneolaceae bacterium]
MNWTACILKVPESLQEQMIAELLDFGFTSFEQFDQSLHCFMSSESLSDKTLSRTRNLLQRYSLPDEIKIEQFEETNWNERWEQSIRPVRTGPFLIYPSWFAVQPETDVIPIQIDPKMSFGTGFHATTRLMLRSLPGLMAANPTNVLDAGTGTGILAIAAAKLGAQSVTGFDIDPWSKRNAMENRKANRVEKQTTFLLGTIDQLSENTQFDLILVNINRNTILEMAHALVKRLHPEGSLLLSGLLHSDQSIILEVFEKEGLNLMGEKREKEWISLQLSSTDSRF